MNLSFKTYYFVLAVVSFCFLICIFLGLLELKSSNLFKAQLITLRSYLRLKFLVEVYKTNVGQLKQEFQCNSVLGSSIHRGSSNVYSRLLTAR